MRSVSVALAALVGAAAADYNPGGYNYQSYNPYPTGGSSSSSSSSYTPSSSSSSAYSTYTPSPSSSSSSSAGYSTWTPSSSASSSEIYHASSSSSQGYSSSSVVSSYSSSSTPCSTDYHSSSMPTGYSSGYDHGSTSEYHHSSMPTGYSSGYDHGSTSDYHHSSMPTGYSSGYNHDSTSKYHHSSMPTGYSSGYDHHSRPPMSTGYATTETEVITTYTTETICPVTKTYGTQVVTTLTTSTITITSCKSGCHHQPTPPASSHAESTPSQSGPVYVPTTITTTTYTWVPCSTSVGNNGGSTIYSTYLTASWYPTTYVTSTLVYPEPTPIVTPVATPPPADNCPAPVTVTKIVTETVGSGHCEACQTKTYTVTEGGYKTTITVTLPPTEVPHSSQVYSSGKPEHSTYVHSSEIYSSKPPMSTGASGYSSIPYSTGSVPYPTSSVHLSYSSGSHAGPKPTGGYYGYY